MNGVTRGTMSSEGGTFLGLWGRELVDWKCCWSLELGFGVVACGEWTTKGIDLLVDS
jgi:hypothetical protein